jgi:hypothetical protein
MPPKTHPDLLLAQTLAAPFTPCSQGTPLSLRRLPDGGLVVIAVDGRKLWFSAAEVNAAREKLNDQARQASQTTKSSLPPAKLVKAPKSQSAAHNGMPIRAAIANNLKVDHDHPDKL